MAIPESQLETWSKQGAVAQSRDTYGSIKSALEDANAPYATKDFNVFLQGSYCNYTNVYAESDVDIVIRCDDFFSFDLDDLTSVAKSEFHKAFPAATYGLSDFKNDVATQLKKKYRRVGETRDEGYLHSGERQPPRGRRHRSGPASTLLFIQQRREPAVRGWHLL